MQEVVVRSCGSDSIFLQYAIERNTLDRTASHGCASVATEGFTVGAKVFGCFLVEGIGRVGFEEEELHANDDGVEVEDWLPILP
jgi:hypothetical protein